MYHYVLLSLLSTLDCQSWLVTVQRARSGDQAAQSFITKELGSEAWPVCEQLLLPGVLSTQRDTWAKGALASLAARGRNPAFAREALLAWWRLRTPNDDIAWIRDLAQAKSNSLRRAAVALLASAGDTKAQGEIEKDIRSSCEAATFGLVMGVAADVALLADPPLPARVDFVCPSSVAQRAGFEVGEIVVDVAGDQCNGIVACQNRIVRALAAAHSFEIRVEIKGRSVTRIVSK